MSHVIHTYVYFKLHVRTLLVEKHVKCSICAFLSAFFSIHAKYSIYVFSCSYMCFCVHICEQRQCTHAYLCGLTASMRSQYMLFMSTYMCFCNYRICAFNTNMWGWNVLFLNIHAKYSICAFFMFIYVLLCSYMNNVKVRMRTYHKVRIFTFKMFAYVLFWQLCEHIYPCFQSSHAYFTNVRICAFSTNMRSCRYGYFGLKSPPYWWWTSVLDESVI